MLVLSLDMNHSPRITDANAAEDIEGKHAISVSHSSAYDSRKVKLRKEISVEHFRVYELLLSRAAKYRDMFHKSI